MNGKEKAPAQTGASSNSESVGIGSQPQNNIFVLPVFKGHFRRCAKCRRPYQLEPMACTIRDGRQTHCPECFWDVAVKVHGEYARGER